MKGAYLAIAFAMTVTLSAGITQPANAEEAAKKPATEATKQEEKEVIVTVKSGDTLSSIADANKTTYVRIFNANESIVDPNIINEGDKIRIPKEDEALTDRYAEYEASLAQYIATVATSPAYNYNYSQPSYGYATTSYAGSTAGNTYYQGYCTWYAKNRRPDLPNMLGNGGQWVGNAAAQGYATGSTPKVGAIAETAGHVTYVEAVNGDGTITISEMNGAAGFGNVGTRTVAANQYQYIY